MESYIPEVFISEEEIREKVELIGKAITQDYVDDSIVVICVLKGAFMFCSDLIRSINLPVRMEFISASSYGDSTSSSGEVKFTMDLTGPIENENVVIVEDIVDTGLTMTKLKSYIESKNPKSIKLATLLFKPDKIRHQTHIDYLAFEVDDKFVVGYGLDYAGRYRELPYIGVLNGNQ